MSVSLSQGMRNAVYSLGDINNAIAVANKRLATGKKVNSAIDNASAFFRASGLNKDGRDMSALLDGMERATKVISKAGSAIEGMRKIAESAQALTRQAQQLADTDLNRNTLRDQVAGLMNQFNAIARDAGYDGQQVLTTGTTAALAYTVNTNVSGSTSVTIAAVDLRVGVAGGVDANTFTAALTGITPTSTASSQTFAGTACGPRLPARR